MQRADFWLFAFFILGIDMPSVAFSRCTFGDMSLETTRWFLTLLPNPLGA